MTKPSLAAQRITPAAQLSTAHDSRQHFTAGSLLQTAPPDRFHKVRAKWAVQPAVLVRSRASLSAGTADPSSTHTSAHTHLLRQQLHHSTGATSSSDPTRPMPAGSLRRRRQGVAGVPENRLHRHPERRRQRHRRQVAHLHGVWGGGQGPWQPRGDMGAVAGAMLRGSRWRSTRVSGTGTAL